MSVRSSQILLVVDGFSFRMRRGGRRASAVFLLLLAACSSGGEEERGAGKPVSPQSALPVDVYVVQPSPLAISVPATGTLLAQESVELVSELSRRLVRVRAEEGARVKKGDVLFELDTSDLQAELQRVQVQQELAKKNADRQKSLLAERVTTEAESDIAQSTVAELAASRRVLAVTVDKATIRAPFSGVLGLRRVSEGAWVSPATILISLHDTSRLKLDFRIPERYAPSVRVGETFRVQVESRGELLEGKILAVEPAVDAASRSLLVRGLVENTEGLSPGAFAKVELPLRIESALQVPLIAVIPSVSGKELFVEREGVAHSVSVELGVRGTELVQVLSGLKAGDRVIVNNLLRLRDGARVQVEKTTP